MSVFRNFKRDFSIVALFHRKQNLLCSFYICEPDFIGTDLQHQLHLTLQVLWKQKWSQDYEDFGLPGGNLFCLFVCGQLLVHSLRVFP